MTDEQISREVKRRCLLSDAEHSLALARDCVTRMDRLDAERKGHIADATRSRKEAQAMIPQMGDKVEWKI